MVVTKHMDSFTPGTVSPEVLKKGVDKIRKLLIPKSRQTHAARTTQAPFPQVQPSQLPDMEALLEAIRPPQNTGSQDHRRRSRWTSLECACLYKHGGAYSASTHRKFLRSFYTLSASRSPTLLAAFSRRAPKRPKKGLLYYSMARWIASVQEYPPAAVMGTPESLQSAVAQDCIARFLRDYYCESFHWEGDA